MRKNPVSGNSIEPSRQFPYPWNRIYQIATRILVWGSFFAVLYILRSFFLLLFLTFVFAYVQARGVDRLAGKLKNRIIRVVVVAAIFLGVLVSVGLFVAPQVQSQAKVFANQFGSYVARVDQEIVAAAEGFPLLEDAIRDFRREPQASGKQTAQTGPGDSITVALIQTLLATEGERANGETLRRTVDTIRNIGGYLLAIGSAFLLALLLSFLIVLDLPRLSRSVHDLQYTRVGFIYNEVAENILGFSRVLGRSLEAQLFIAVANTVLTASGLIFLGLSEKLAFLSVIVFLCSFIPVAGVFISSVPICLVALQTSGLQGVLLVIALIIVIHLIEGYILNPRIYGSRLRINPVIVLIILTVSGKLFHLWGLILGVPVCSYLFGYAIRDRHVE